MKHPQQNDKMKTKQVGLNIHTVLRAHNHFHSRKQHFYFEEIIRPFSLGKVKTI